MEPHPTFPGVDSSPSEDTRVVTSNVLNTMGSSPGPERTALRRERLASKKRADLWSAVWEASQFLTYDEIRDVVEGTINEIVSDEP